MRRTAGTAADSLNRRRHWHNLRRQAKRSGHPLSDGHPAKPPVRCRAHGAMEEGTVTYIVVPPAMAVSASAAGGPEEGRGTRSGRPATVRREHWKDHKRFLREAGSPEWAASLRRSPAPPGRTERVATASADGPPPPDVRSLDALGIMLVNDPSPAVLKQMRDAGAEVLEDEQVHLVGPEPAAAPGPADGSSRWHLDRINAKAAARQGLDGRDVEVGILDTGIDATHPEFKGITINFKAFRASMSPKAALERKDYEAHGTHVCGIIAGRSAGLAPRVKLKVAAVLTQRDASNRPTGDLSDVLSGLNWLLTDDSTGDTPPVVNASISFSRPYPKLETRIKEAYADNLTLVVAAIGNNGRSGAGNTTAPGNYAAVVGTGATDREDMVADFSDWDGAKPDLCAPGVGILSAVPGGMQTMSGTSMASPLVAATAALLIQKDADLRDSPSRLAKRLLELVVPATPSTKAGAGRLDLTAL